MKWSSKLSISSAFVVLAGFLVFWLYQEYKRELNNLGTVRSLEEARKIIEELQDAVKKIEENHREVETHRQMAVQELKNLSVALMEKVERNTREAHDFRFDDYVKKVKQLAKESGEKIKAEKNQGTARVGIGGLSRWR